MFAWTGSDTKKRIADAVKAKQVSWNDYFIYFLQISSVGVVF